MWKILTVTGRIKLKDTFCGMSGHSKLLMETRFCVSSINRRTTQDKSLTLSVGSRKLSLSPVNTACFLSLARHFVSDFMLYEITGRR